jgi:hypothetical protein
MIVVARGFPGWTRNLPSHGAPVKNLSPSWLEIKTGGYRSPTVSDGFLPKEEARK